MKIQCLLIIIESGTFKIINNYLQLILTQFTLEAVTFFIFKMIFISVELIKVL